MLAGSVVTPTLISCGTDKPKQMGTIKNWAGNLTYGTTSVVEPKTVAEVQEAVLKFDKIRAQGTRHCFNTIADSDQNLLSTRNLNQVVIDEAAHTVTVEAGVRYGDFCKRIHEAGFAVHNLASLPHISVAGACATATHGSGITNGNLSTAVIALELVNAQGEIVTISRERDREVFYGAVVGLGSLGVVTNVTLELVPTFLARQHVYLNLPMASLEKGFDEIMGSGYSVSLFYDWQTENINQVWIKRMARPDDGFIAPPDFFGAKLADRNVHPILEISAENCTEQMGVPGPWYDRLPHFKMGFTPSSGEELQAEYFVPRAQAVEAIKAVATLRDEIKPYLMITEVRTIDADSLWMSPCYKQPSVAIHFTLKQDVEGVNKLLPKIEEKLAPFGVRPHWGKLFTIAPATLQSRYEKMEDFKKLVQQFDPSEKFRNEFVDRNIFGAGV